ECTAESKAPAFATRISRPTGTAACAPQNRVVPQSETFSSPRGFYFVGRVFKLSIVFCAVASMHAQISVEIDLQEQTAYLIRGRQLVLESPISSGRYGHLTQTGSFEVEI